MGDLAKGAIGAEGTYDVAFSGGTLTLTLGYTGKQGSANLQFSENLAQLLQAAAAATTNTIEKEALQGAAALISAIQ